AEVAVAGLSDTEADEFVLRIVGGPLTPDARPRIIEMAQGNPLHLREIVRGSVDDGRLVGTEHGWELRDAPSPTPRLAQLAGDRLAGLSNGVQEAAAMVAIAGELPAGALDPDRRRILLRRGVLEYAAGGWLR